MTETYVYNMRLENEELSTLEYFNYPNPFSTAIGERTRLRYSILKRYDSGRLLIFDSAGDVKYMKELADKDLTWGTHEIEWDGMTGAYALDTGVYFTVIQFIKNDGKENTRVNKIAIIND